MCVTSWVVIYLRYNSFSFRLYLEVNAEASCNNIINLFNYFMNTLSNKNTCYTKYLWKCLGFFVFVLLNNNNLNNYKYIQQQIHMTYCFLFLYVNKVVSSIIWNIVPTMVSVEQFLQYYLCSCKSNVFLGKYCTPFRLFCCN